MPFYGNEQQIAAMIQQSTPMNNGPKERWSGISEEAKDLVRKMFRRSPIDRISAEQALKHPWITGARAIVNPAVPLDGNLNATARLQQFARASEFRRACVRMMIWSIPSEEQAQIREAFVYLDTESKGVIDVDTIAGKLGLSDMYKSEIQKAFGKEMRYSDFVAVMACSRVADHTELVKEAFRRFDIGNSGLLTEKDLQTALGEKFDCGAVLARFPDSQISATEFIAYLSSEKLGEMDDEMLAGHTISRSPSKEVLLCETIEEI
jgi:calcium-dependent protein kinase